MSIVVVTVLLSSFTFYFYQVVYAPNFLVDKESRAVIIPYGSSFEDVQKIIYDQGFVNEPVAFGLLARLMKYDGLVKPGKFMIEKNSSNIEVIRKLRSGDQVPVRITFNNSRLIEDVADKITANIGLNADEFLVYVNDSSTAAEYDFDDETFRCMFIPNTYEVYWTISKKELIDRLYKEYKLFWNEQRKAKAKEIDLTPIEVSILASIVQAEVSHHDESPVVAGLYLNRLKRSMPLQADPTLVYAAGDFTIKRVLNVHKEIESPYNTYKYAGLPPGPINFPSIISIDAVLNYDKNNYLYMCAREDFSGYHNFSSSLRQHNINARKYQQALDNAKLFK